jgi:hypothetical protein
MISETRCEVRVRVMSKSDSGTREDALGVNRKYCQDTSILSAGAVRDLVLLAQGQQLVCHEANGKVFDSPNRSAPIGYALLACAWIILVLLLTLLISALMFLRSSLKAAIRAYDEDALGGGGEQAAGTVLDISPMLTQSAAYDARVLINVGNKVKASTYVSSYEPLTSTSRVCFSNPSQTSCAVWIWNPWDTYL